MSQASFVYTDNPGGKPLKTWTRGVTIEDAAMQQLLNVGKLPFIHSHVAAMPDVHYGKGATIGSVIATNGAIVPAAIGVDIGCGMQAVKLNLLASELGDRAEIRAAIEKAVPHGRTDNGGPADRGAWHDIPDVVEQAWSSYTDVQPLSLRLRWEAILEDTPELAIKNTVRHLGTLGSGNHFIEVQEGTDGYLWLMLHSGSRGPGAKIANHWMKVAKDLMKKWFITLPDPDLAYFIEGTPEFDSYITGMHWAQDFARTNRDLMMDAVIRAIGFDPEFNGEDGDILFRHDCHHNFTQRERHDGKHLWITRKGATSARKDEFGIIPGSMGTGSFIVKGLGNRDAFMSCSHGAGRAMSRTQAFKTISLEDHARAVEGIECRRDKDVLDESPAAYKDVNAVIAAQEGSLITIHERLKTLINVKG